MRKILERGLILYTPLLNSIWHQVGVFDTLSSFSTLSMVCQIFTQTQHGHHRHLQENNTLCSYHVSYHAIWHTIDSVLKLESVSKTPTWCQIEFNNGVYRIKPLSRIFLMISKPNRPSVSVTLNDIYIQSMKVFRYDASWIYSRNYSLPIPYSLVGNWTPRAPPGQFNETYFLDS